MDEPDQDIDALLNLGPKNAGWLHAVGIHTGADLERVGAVAAYRLVKQRQPRASFQLLYALHGVLSDIPWNEVDAATKRQLVKEASDLAD